MVTTDNHNFSRNTRDGSDYIELYCPVKERSLTAMDLDTRIVFCPFCGGRIGAVYPETPSEKSGSEGIAWT